MFWGETIMGTEETPSGGLIQTFGTRLWPLPIQIFESENHQQIYVELLTLTFESELNGVRDSNVKVVPLGTPPCFNVLKSYAILCWARGFSILADQLQL